MKSKISFFLFFLLMFFNTKAFVEDRFCIVKIIDNENNSYEGIIHIDTRFLCCPDTTIITYHLLYRNRSNSQIYGFNTLFHFGEPSLIEFVRVGNENNHYNSIIYLKKKYNIKSHKIFDLQDSINQIFILQNEIKSSNFETTTNEVILKSSSEFIKQSLIKIWIFKKQSCFFQRTVYSFEEKLININDVSFMLYLPIKYFKKSKLINEFTKNIWKKNRTKITMPVFFF